MAGFSRHWPLPRRAPRLIADKLDAHEGTSIDAPSFCEGHAMPLNCLDIYGIDRVVKCDREGLKKRLSLFEGPGPSGYSITHWEPGTWYNY